MDSISRVDSDLFRSVNDFQARTAWLHGSALSYAKIGGPVDVAMGGWLLLQRPLIAIVAWLQRSRLRPRVRA